MVCVSELLTKVVRALGWERNHCGVQVYQHTARKVRYELVYKFNSGEFTRYTFGRHRDQYLWRHYSSLVVNSYIKFISRFSGLHMYFTLPSCSLDTFLLAMYVLTFYSFFKPPRNIDVVMETSRKICDEQKYQIPPWRRHNNII